jgi:hypothetical protein
VSYFPELEFELELLGLGCNADLAKDVMEAFWARTRWASESLSSMVPSLAARSPPNGDGEE